MVGGDRLLLLRGRGRSDATHTHTWLCSTHHMHELHVHKEGSQLMYVRTYVCTSPNPTTAVCKKHLQCPYVLLIHASCECTYVQEIQVNVTLTWSHLCLPLPCQGRSCHFDELHWNKRALGKVLTHPTECTTHAVMRTTQIHTYVCMHRDSRYVHTVHRCISKQLRQCCQHHHTELSYALKSVH